VIRVFRSLDDGRISRRTAFSGFDQMLGVWRQPSSTDVAPDPLESYISPCRILPTICAKFVDQPLHCLHETQKVP